MIQELIPNDSGYYSIEKSSLSYLPFQIEPNQAIIFRCSHTNFYKNQMWSIRLWVSKVVNGITIHDYPYSLRFVSALKTPIAFGFHDNSYDQITAEASWTWPIAPDHTYYLNIQNMENKFNRYFLESEIVSL